jgi:hypothetical protein
MHTYKVALRALALLAMIHAGMASAETKIKGMRVDPSYLYGMAASAQAAAQLIVNDAVAMGVNTLFMYSYSPVYGAFYKTTYQYTAVENGFGIEDMLGNLITAAHAKGIKVVAWLPVNDFKQAAKAQPSWRAKTQTGANYVPYAGTFVMSAWHPGFRSWYKGFLTDLLTHYPALDGIEAGEGQVDYNWDMTTDYNPTATQLYKQAYPRGTVGDANWVKFRTQGMTGLHQILGTVAHQYGRKAYVVQTWSPYDDGTGDLMSSADIAAGCGFDFDGIMNLPAPGRPDVVTGEFMYQQWAATDTDVTPFTTAWTIQAARQFIANVAGRVTPVVHVEISDFGTGPLTPADFGAALQDAYTNSTGGADFYDFYQIETDNAQGDVTAVYYGH